MKFWHLLHMNRKGRSAERACTQTKTWQKREKRLMCYVLVWVLQVPVQPSPGLLAGLEPRSLFRAEAEGPEVPALHRRRRVCRAPKPGSSLITNLQNMIPYVCIWHQTCSMISSPLDKSRYRKSKYKTVMTCKWSILRINITFSQGPKALIHGVVSFSSLRLLWLCEVCSWWR